MSVDEPDKTKGQSKDDFDLASETRPQKITRLEKEADALEAKLKEPPQRAQTYLTRGGMVRHDGNEHVREMMAYKRTNIEEELKVLKLEQKAHERSMEKVRERTKDRERQR